MRERLNQLKARFPFMAFGLEVFSIVLAVLLALGVNEWREARSQRQLVQKAIANIRQEVLSNRPTMAERYPYHRGMRDSVRANLDLIEGQAMSEVADSTLGVGEKGFFFTGASSSAWDAANTSRATSYMDYDTLELVGHIYGLQESLVFLQEKAADLFFNPVAVQDEHFATTIMLFSNLLTDIVNVERQLIESYDAFLARTASVAPSDTTGQPQPDTTFAE